MKLSKSLIALIKEEIGLGYITRTKHPELNIYILNYSNTATWEWRWNDATKICRGLIVDADYNVINRSYYKFFDIEQIETSACDDVWTEHNTEKYKVAHKKDGFLGVMYVDAETSDVICNEVKLPSSKMAIATRGSFTSNMAIRATKILREKYAKVNWDTRYTYNFEIIYPNGLLTIHYGIEDVILHGIFDNETGEEIWLEDFKDYDYFKSIGLSMEQPVEESECFKGIEDFYTKFKYNDDEGYVISFESGYKIKVKFDEYKKLAYAKRSLEKLYSKKFVKKVIDGSVDKVINENPGLKTAPRMEAIEIIKNYHKSISDKYDELCEIVNKNLLETGKEITMKDFVSIARDNYPDDAGLMISCVTKNKNYTKYLVDITIEKFSTLVS
jgi:hypothetical protein